MNQCPTTRANEDFSSAAAPRDQRQAVLRAMEEVPREHFRRGRRSRSTPIATTRCRIACGQTISQPYVVAYMTEHLRLQRDSSRARDRHRLRLSGGGAVAAVPRGREIERTARWPSGPARACRRSATTMSRSMLGDGLDVPCRHGAFDRIIVTAAVEQIPDGAGRAACAGGVLIAPVGPHAGAQTLVELVQDARRDRRAGALAGAFRAAAARSVRASL